ncbi:hypothetical protein [Altererythrobacter sp. Z27]|uniref:hypothetical protein n=1 Tax=Altererythrobacter sp. Z27 TaxID=3461147 RepID=UPI004043EF11
MFHEPEFLLFASEADLVALAGGGFLILALLALLGDRMRNQRERVERLDRVGWVPWTGVFVACAIIGGGLLAMSLPQALFGG